MTDTFEVQGDFTPAETFADTFATPADDTPVVPNGFIAMGLAPELIRAVEDLGEMEVFDLSEAVKLYS